MSYDYIIIGAGPTGLTVAYGLANKGKRVLVVDRQSTIGGCHRVVRVNGYFTEHSPRVYLSSFVNMMKWFKHMHIDDLFTPYHFNIPYVANKLIDKLSWYECGCMAWAFTRCMFQSEYGNDKSVHDFVIESNFSEESKDYIDRLCRFTDGAGSERYRLKQFLEMMNQNAMYTILQPKLPNDIAMFPHIQHAMARKGVTFLLDADVEEILMNNAQTRVTGISVHHDLQSVTLQADNVILAVPPKDLSIILNASLCSNAFGSLEDWTIKSSYDTHVSAIFHWNQELDIPNIYGFPFSEWGLIFIPLSNYMAFDHNSKTVISTSITYLDRRSSETGQTANEMSDSGQLIAEMFRQLKLAYPSLPQPTFSCLSPTMYRDQGKWVNQDSAYIHAKTSGFLSSKGSIPNLFQVGVQNGHSPLHATTFEAAVANGIVFLEEQNMPLFPLQKPTTVRSVLFWIFIAILSLILIYVLYKWYTLKIEKIPLESQAIIIPINEEKVIDTEPIVIPSEDLPIVNEDLISIPNDIPSDTYQPTLEKE
jgi:predicted NAD/FAD-dependent oxidoreductase